MSKHTHEEIYGVDLNEYQNYIGETIESIIGRNKKQLELLYKRKEKIKHEWVKEYDTILEGGKWDLLRVSVNTKIDQKKENIERLSKLLPKPRKVKVRKWEDMAKE